jgi:hypothetical protein
MDEQKLRDLFSSAVRDVPPASFDVSDVAAASKRITVRKRSVFAGGGVVVVAAIVVGLVIGGGSLGHTLGGGTSNAAGAAAAAPTTCGRNEAAPLSDTRTGGKAQQQIPNETQGNSPTTTPKQGGGLVGGVGPGAGGAPSGCGPTDRELAVALANELASAGAPQSFPPTGLNCPAGVGVASYYVIDGQATGFVVAIITNAGQPTPTDTSPGSARFSAPDKQGRTITLLSVPAPGSPTAPFSGALFGMLEDIAAKV